MKRIPKIITYNILIFHFIGFVNAAQFNATQVILFLKNIICET